MNKLINYINEVGGLELAKQLNVTPGCISHIKTGRNKISVKMARDIERLTDGQITRHELRPDIFGDIQKTDIA